MSDVDAMVIWYGRREQLYLAMGDLRRADRCAYSRLALERMAR